MEQDAAIDVALKGQNRTTDRALHTTMITPLQGLPLLSQFFLQGATLR
ncbi:MAG: hypothetical protein LBS01_00720 [Prevotellaceae bacterium]|jgi:hypothetical protein|nr:hypothetical protein [Prevotellaceae bacterium]